MTISPPNRNSQNDRAFRRGNAMSAAPIWSGTMEFAKPIAIGAREEQQHQRAVHREQLVVGRRVDQLAAGRRQLEPDDRSASRPPSDREEHERG